MYTEYQSRSHKSQIVLAEISFCHFLCRKTTLSYQKIAGHLWLITEHGMPRPCQEFVAARQLSRVGTSPKFNKRRFELSISFVKTAKRKVPSISTFDLLRDSSLNRKITIFINWMFINYFEARFQLHISINFFNFSASRYIIILQHVICAHFKCYPMLLISIPQHKSYFLLSMKNSVMSVGYTRCSSVSREIWNNLVLPRPLPSHKVIFEMYTYRPQFTVQVTLDISVLSRLPARISRHQGQGINQKQFVVIWND